MKGTEHVAPAPAAARKWRRAKVAPTPAVTCAAPAPGIECAPSSPAAACAAPTPVSKYVDSSPTGTSLAAFSQMNEAALLLQRWPEVEAAQLKAGQGLAAGALLEEEEASGQEEQAQEALT